MLWIFSDKNITAILSSKMIAALKFNAKFVDGNFSQNSIADFGIIGCDVLLALNIRDSHSLKVTL